MQTTAKVNNQYDYITLRIKFSNAETFNLTRSRNGVKVSGSMASRSSLDFFDMWLKQSKIGTIGETMEYLAASARSCPTFQDFLKTV